MAACIHLVPSAWGPTVSGSCALPHEACVPPTEYACPTGRPALCTVVCDFHGVCPEVAVLQVASMPIIKPESHPRWIRSTLIYIQVCSPLGLLRMNCCNTHSRIKCSPQCPNTRRPKSSKAHSLACILFVAIARKTWPTSCNKREDCKYSTISLLTYSKEHAGACL